MSIPQTIQSKPPSFVSMHQEPTSGSFANIEIANIRVSKDCAIRLVADGPYNKRSIEALVKNLELQLSLGTYDEVESDSPLD